MARRRNGFVCGTTLCRSGVTVNYKHCGFDTGPGLPRRPSAGLPPLLETLFRGWPKVNDCNGLFTFNNLAAEELPCQLASYGEGLPATRGRFGQQALTATLLLLR